MPPGVCGAELRVAVDAAARAAACGAAPPSSSSGSLWISLPAGLPTVPALPGENAVVCADEMFLVVPLIAVFATVLPLAVTAPAVALVAAPAVPA